MSLRALPRAAQTHCARFILGSLVLGASLLVTANAQAARLTVSTTGSGTVTSSPTGISCGAACSASFPWGTSVTLTASAASGYRFSGWSGACSGTNTSCTVSMTRRWRRANATFSQNVVTTTPSVTNYTLTVSTSGSGTVMSSPAGIDCGATCSASYASGTSVTLTAAAASGYSFSGWGGDCSGTGTSCTVSVTAARSVTAAFSATTSNSAILTWTPPATATNLSGYRLYYGTAPRTYLQPYGQGTDLGNVTTYTLLGLSNGTRYYFAVTAVDTLGGESPYSSEVFKDIP